MVVLAQLDKVFLGIRHQHLAQMRVEAAVPTPPARRVLALLKASMVAMAGSRSFLFTVTRTITAVAAVADGRAELLTRPVAQAVAVVVDTPLVAQQP